MAPPEKKYLSCNPLDSPNLAAETPEPFQHLTAIKINLTRFLLGKLRVLPPTREPFQVCCAIMSASHFNHHRQQLAWRQPQEEHTGILYRVWNPINDLQSFATLSSFPVESPQAPRLCPVISPALSQLDFSFDFTPPNSKSAFICLATTRDSSRVKLGTVEENLPPQISFISVLTQREDRTHSQWRALAWALWTKWESLEWGTVAFPRKLLQVNTYYIHISSKQNHLSGSHFEVHFTRDRMQ